MRNRRDLWLVGGILVSLALLALLLGPAAGTDDGDPRMSSYLSGEDGARALFLTLQELGIPADRRLEPWDPAGLREARTGALAVLAPARRPTPREIEGLMDWVREGGTLIYGAPPIVDPFAEELGLRTLSGAPDTLGPLQAVRWMERRAEGLEARPSAPHPWTTDAGPISGFHRVFDREAAGLDDAEVLLATDEGEPVVVLVRIGDGRVLAWSDPWVLSNGRLREGVEGGALVFARAATAAAEGGQVLAFDEYHQGFRADGGPALALRRFLTGTGAGRWLLQAGMAALALLLLAGARMGAPIPEAGTQRRSPLEHVEAVSAAYRKAGARRTARRLLLAGLDRRLGRRWPRLLEVAAAEPEASTATRRLHEAARREAEADNGEEDLVALAAAVDEFVREVRGWTRAK